MPLKKNLCAPFTGLVNKAAAVEYHFDLADGYWKRAHISARQVHLIYQGGILLANTVQGLCFGDDLTLTYTFLL